MPLTQSYLEDGRISAFQSIVEVTKKYCCFFIVSNLAKLKVNLVRLSIGFVKLL